MRRPLFAFILGVAMIMSVGGCVSLLPKTKPAQLYRFGAEGSGQLERAGSAVEGPSGAQKIGVVLEQVGFARASTSDGILTVTGDQMAYIAGARWVAPARILFQEAVERAFDSQGKAIQIVKIGDVGPAGAILRIDVTAFEARYRRKGPSPVAAISLSARLTRADGRVLDQRDFAVLEPASANGVSAIVHAFDQATDKILADVVGWVDAKVPAAVNSAAPSPAATTTSTTTTSSSSSTTTTVPPQR
jgi:cholesterol transport system auxiliary component